MKPSPLNWPSGRTRQRFRESPRTTLTIASALPALRKELDMLGVVRVVVSSNAKLKLNGDPYSQQPKSVDDPGVAVWFEHLRAAGTHFCLSCDQYDTIGGNLNEIRLAVAELRGWTRRMLLPITDALKPFVASTPTQRETTPAVARMTKRGLGGTVTKPVPEWQVVLGVETVKKLTWNDCLTSYQVKLRAAESQAQRDQLVAAQTEAAMHFGRDV